MRLKSYIECLVSSIFYNNPLHVLSYLIFICKAVSIKLIKRWGIIGFASQIGKQMFHSKNLSDISRLYN